jgi:DNA invertase Pin-like site-specific DNA recombinase
VAHQFVAYYRVSTDRQGRSGLGLDAQREAVFRHLAGHAGQLVAEFCEIESGSRSDRPQLAAAIAAAKKARATLIIAKLDRLARNVHFISGLMESGVDFVAADNPHANKLMVHMLAAFAEHEREQISQRTKDALAAAKLRGIRLGRNAAEPIGTGPPCGGNGESPPAWTPPRGTKARWHVGAANGSRIDGARYSNAQWCEMAWADGASDD